MIRSVTLQPRGPRPRRLWGWRRSFLGPGSRPVEPLPTDQHLRKPLGDDPGLFSLVIDLRSGQIAHQSGPLPWTHARGGYTLPKRQ